MKRPHGNKDRFRLTRGSAVGYLVFAAGTLLGVWRVWLAWKPQSNDNPLVVPLLVWMIAGITHIFVRNFWRACQISAVGSVLGYIVFALVGVLFGYPNPFLNEMFGAGMIEVGLFGFVLSMVMGVPVVFYRRSGAGVRLQVAEKHVSDAQPIINNTREVRDDDKSNQGEEEQRLS